MRKKTMSQNFIITQMKPVFFNNYAFFQSFTFLGNHESKTAAAARNLKQKDFMKVKKVFAVKCELDSGELIYPYSFVNSSKRFC